MSLTPLKWFVAVSLLGVLFFYHPFSTVEPIATQQLSVKLGGQTDHQPQEPALKFALLPANLYPGDVLYVESSQPKMIQLWKQSYQLQASGNKFVKFISIPMEMKPGIYPLQSTDQTIRTNVVIKAKTFPFEAITVSKQMENMKSNTKKINEDQKKINQARSQSAATPYFTGKFQLPIEGKLTTPYGYRRIVNNKPDSPHLAIDLANKTGTPVYAAESGKIVLADTMYLNGNMIIIDHGLNVFATYSHLSKIEVQQGELVQKGQLIGRVGTTGFSTGPHLHYAMLIGNTFVNPNSFFEEDFVQ